MRVSENHTAKDADLADLRAELAASDAVQRRIGQDLHDGLGQLLTGVAYLLRGLEADVPAALRPRVARLGELAQSAVEKTAHIARGLAPFHLQDAPLRVVLEELARSSHELLGVACTVTVSADVPVAHAAAMQLYFIGQEAIRNAVRHGNAQHVAIAFTHGPSDSHERTLTITDDGAGFATLVEGLGIRSMRLRARTFGGALTVERAPDGGGVRLRCTWHELVEAK